MRNIKVKVTFPFPKLDLSRQIPLEKQCLDPFTFYVNPHSKDEVYDYWIVYENIAQPVERTLLSHPNGTLFITGEPPTVKTYAPAFLRQFNHVISSHENIRHPNLILTQQALPWTVEKTYDALKEIKDVPKTKFMSLITSNKTLTEGHKKRLEFALKLKTLFPDSIDLFGRGINNFNDKWTVLAPYRYHLCIENASVPNYFTEKLVDAYLCLSFPLYYGCPNLEKYFSSEAYQNIPIDNITAAAHAIENLIREEDHYAHHLDALKTARKDCLDRYNLFPFLKSFLGEHLQRQLTGSKSQVVSKKIVQSPVDVVKYFAKRCVSRARR